jgi:hypothetical protein
MVNSGTQLTYSGHHYRLRTKDEFAHRVVASNWFRVDHTSAGHRRVAFANATHSALYGLVSDNNNRFLTTYQPTGRRRAHPMLMFHDACVQQVEMSLWSLQQNFVITADMPAYGQDAFAIHIRGRRSTTGPGRRCRYRGVRARALQQRVRLHGLQRRAGYGDRAGILARERQARVAHRHGQPEDGQGEKQRASRSGQATPPMPARSDEAGGAAGGSGEGRATRHAQARARGEGGAQAHVPAATDVCQVRPSTRLALPVLCALR